MIVHGDCVDLLAFYDWSGKRRESCVLLQRQFLAQKSFDRILDQAAFRGDLFDMDLLVGSLRLAETDIEEHKERQAGHDEHREPVGKTTAKAFIGHTTHPHRVVSLAPSLPQTVHPRPGTTARRFSWL